MNWSGGANQSLNVSFQETPPQATETSGKLPNFQDGLRNTCYMNSGLQLLAQRSDDELHQLFDVPFRVDLEQGETQEIIDARANFRAALRAVLGALKRDDNDDVALQHDVSQYGFLKKLIKVMGGSPEPDAVQTVLTRIPRHSEHQMVHSVSLRNMAVLVQQSSAFR